MSLIFAIFLGLVQGITEFLPLSSSGHLAIFQNIFGMENAEKSHLFFDVMLHFGTLISVCVVFRRDIWAIIKALAGLVTGKRETVAQGNDAGENSGVSIRLLLLIIVATIPLVAVVFLKDYIELLYTNTTFVGFALIITGGLLYISDKLIAGHKKERKAKLSDAVVVGLMQALAVLPGLSRAGSTITAGLFRGFDREFAVKFSFLMSIPAILGANILSVKDAIEQGIDWSLMPLYLVGVAVAAVAGFFAINLVKVLARKNKFGKFAYYCWTVGLVVIIASFFI